MKRFFFEDEDDDGNEDEMMEEAGNQMPEFIPEIFTMSHQENPAVHILNYSVRICEQSFFWQFMGNARKIAMIESVFNSLMKLIDVDSSRPEEEEKE